MKLVRLLAAGGIAAASLIAVPSAQAAPLLDLSPEQLAALDECLGVPLVDDPNDPEDIYSFLLTMDNIIIGTPEDDVIKGTNKNDAICGGDGDDTIYGYGGDDSILGDGITFQPFFELPYTVGDDTVYGGSGDDELLVGFGDDVAYGENGNDFLPLAVGADKGYGGNGNDEIIGGHGVDVVDGGNGDDRLAGGFGNDAVTGGNGADTLYGELPEGFPAPPFAQQPASTNDVCDGGNGNKDLAVQCDVDISIEGEAPIAPPEEG